MGQRTFRADSWQHRAEAIKIDRAKNGVVQIVEQTIVTYRMFQSGDSALVCVSGGPDSLALLHVLLALAPRFSLRLGIAHLNHSLRQKDSDSDAEFVASLAKKLGLPCYIGKEDVRKYRLENRLSLQEAARRVRYAFFNSVAEKNWFSKIALGHNEDDNAELVLMYLFRGSGPLGISGIPPVRDGQKEHIKIVRPLIKLTRLEITDFLAAEGLRYISDRSNKDTRYLRNRIRHYLIPSLKASYNPRIVKTINRLASITRSEEEWIEDVINPAFEKSVLAAENSKITLSVPRLDRIHIAAKRRIIRKAIAKIKGDLRRITLFHIDAAISLLESRPASGISSLDLPGRIRIRRNGDILLFSKERRALRNLNPEPSRADAPSFEYKILKDESIFIKETGMHLKFSEIGIENLPDFRYTGHQVAFFDMDSLSFPLVVRNFRAGDRFNPLGMTGKQKVKKYFINSKVSRSERLRCPILLSQERIIWVVGFRIDNFVKVKPSTKNVLRVELFSHKKSSKL